MSDIFVPDLIEETATGIFARHAGRFTLPVLVAPTTSDRDDAHNRLRRQMVTVACANLKDFAFAFDSSFLAPTSADGFDRLMKLIKLYPGCPLSVFGHADPDGKPTYNKWLSERRAQSVMGLLLRRTAVWEHLFSQQDGAPGDLWGKASLQVMLDTLKFPPGNLTGAFDAESKKALRGFLDSIGSQALPAQDTAPVRAKLFQAYMDALTPVDPEDPAKGKWKLKGDDFLAGATATMGNPGDVQGCSLFNPQMVLAKREAEGYEKGGKPGEKRRHRANEPNRRVVIYLFEKGTKKPSTWPCPPASKGISQCEERFWVDGEERKNTRFTEHRRRFGKETPLGKAVLEPPDLKRSLKLAREETTFACRFYHGMALHSPCERDLKMWVLRLWAGGPDAPLAGARYAATIGTDAGAPIIRGVTTASGILGLPLFDDQVTITLRVDVGPAVIKGFPAQFTGIVVKPQRGPQFRAITETTTTTTAGDTDGAVTAPAPTSDSQAFPGEELFFKLVLNGGALARIKGPPPPKPPGTPDPDPDPGADFDAVDQVPLAEAERQRGVAQRLRNLNFGDAKLEVDVVLLRSAIREFQLGFRTPDNSSGNLDDATVDQLQLRYGEQIDVERPPT